MLVDTEVIARALAVGHALYTDGDVPAVGEWLDGVINALAEYGSSESKAPQAEVSAANALLVDCEKWAPQIVLEGEPEYDLPVGPDMYAQDRAKAERVARELSRYLRDYFGAS